MKLGRVHVDKLGDWPHEPDVIGLLVNLRLFDGAQVDLVLWDLVLPLLLDEIPDYILDLALALLRNLHG